MLHFPVEQNRKSWVSCTLTIQDPHIHVRLLQNIPPWMKLRFCCFGLNKILEVKLVSYILLALTYKSLEMAMLTNWDIPVWTLNIVEQINSKFVVLVFVVVVIEIQQSLKWGKWRWLCEKESGGDCQSLVCKRFADCRFENPIFILGGWAVWVVDTNNFHKMVQFREKPIKIFWFGGPNIDSGGGKFCLP